jgi:hypothetical protein
MACQCAKWRFVRSLEEDDPGLPRLVSTLATTRQARLGRCSVCGAWWERLPHEVYGYAWYQTEQRYWSASDAEQAVAGWVSSRQSQGY